MDVNKIPIIINTFNRVTCLKALVNFLEKTIPNDIIFLDNNSTYEPLLEYFELKPHEVIHLDKNLGHQALWTSKLIDRFNKSYYVLTDPDVVPVKECPMSFMQYFYNLMQEHPEYKKVGFGLKIDDLPDYNPHKNSIISWESQYWVTKVTDNVHGITWRAPIDTTFALFHPTQPGAWGWAIRTDYPYIARHTDWYINPSNLTEEELYYKNTRQGITHWSSKI